jgi:hypothetical protein
VPIFATFEDAEGAKAYCVQPYSETEPDLGEPGLDDDPYAHLVTFVTNGDNDGVWLVPLWGAAVLAGMVTLEDLEVLGVEVCDVISPYGDEVDEVPLSRLNLGRAPDKVLRQQYAEVTAMLAEAAVISLDAAGRLTADGVAIDSSPMNQSIFYELLVNGLLEGKNKAGVATGETFDLPMGFMDIAAMAIGVASDKTTPISIDTIAYINRIYGIPLATEFGTIAVPGTSEMFFDFTGFSYNRADTYKGCFSGLVIDGGNAVPTNGYFLTHMDEEGTLHEGYVFDGNAAATGITGFALWANDARRVNLFLHDNVVLPENTDMVGTDALCEVLFPPPPLEMPEEILRLLPESDLIPDTTVVSTPTPTVVVVDNGRMGKGRMK